MQILTKLPSNYRQLVTLDWSKSWKAVVCAVVSGIVLLITVGWLLVQFTHLLRPTALEGISFSGILTLTPDGSTSIMLPFQLIVDAIVAIVLVMFIHELVHGVFFWRFTGLHPTFRIKGLYIYTAAPSDIYFPRNQYLAVGIAPFVLLTLVGLLLMVIVPVVIVPILILSIAFNAAGAAGDLLMFAWLLSYPPDTLMQDNRTSVIVYGPDKSWKPV